MGKCSSTQSKSSNPNPNEALDFTDSMPKGSSSYSSFFARFHKKMITATPNDTLPQSSELEYSPSMKKINQNRESYLRVYIDPTNKYQMGLIINEGPHGKVYEALSMETGEQVAIKTVMCKTEHMDNIVIYLRRKAMDFDHENLVNYIEITEINANEIYIVSELIGGSSLETLLKTFGKLNENVCRLFVKQMLNGLDELRKKNSYHGNLKPKNIFIDKNGVVKLGDYFIFSRKMLVETSIKTNIRKPVCYYAPEFFLYETKTHKSDIWSLGCMLLEMLTNEKPWKNNNFNAKYIRNSFREGKKPDIPKGLSEMTKSFLLRCFVINPEERASTEELMEHPFLKVDDTIERRKSKFGKMISYQIKEKKTEKKYEKSKSNQNMLFNKMKTAVMNVVIQNEEKKEEKIELNISNNINPEKFLGRMTTAEIRKKNEIERKKIEEELLRSLND